MKNVANQLWNDESGLSATEYGILAAVFAAGLIGVITAFKDKISKMFTDSAAAMP